MSLQPHEQRVVVERDELFERLARLNAFFDSPAFDAVPGDEQRRLLKQINIMGDYLLVLNERIAHFKP